MSDDVNIAWKTAFLRVESEESVNEQLSELKIVKNYCVAKRTTTVEYNSAQLEVSPRPLNLRTKRDATQQFDPRAATMG